MWVIEGGFLCEGSVCICGSVSEGLLCGGSYAYVGQ